MKPLTHIATVMVAVVLAMVTLMSCGSKQEEEIPEPGRAVYYWRTSFSLGDTERDFLKEHKVTKMYVRYFDVVTDDDNKLIPNATITGLDSVPGGLEIIPTVFIVNDCFKQETGDLDSLILRRILQMNETHDVKGVRELQIDCDWTASTAAAYFDFLSSLRDKLAEHDMRLSVTIRLHQLGSAPPPAHYGVLMMYNTGDLKKAKSRNPILSEQDVEPYLKHIGSYSLPLCAAYPCFGWQLLFTGDTFRDILYSENLADSSTYMQVAPDKYLVRTSIDLPNYLSSNSSFTYLNAGDTVLTVKPSAQTVVSVHDALTARRPGINRRVIIYSLDSLSISNYTPQHYETIYRP